MSVSVVASLMPDHPRSRGVYQNSRQNAATRNGSSPLARGLPWPSRSRTVRTWDHPRSRGVYSCLPPRPGCMWGSSPLARGLRPHRRGGRAGEGIIPARAGFTRRPNGDGPKDRDHPRSRGVYEDMGAGNAEDHGSSPLARGLLQTRRSLHTPRRIIPARAGFTITPANGSFPQPDHPRSRGVYAIECKNVTRMDGSSPLARGLQGSLPVHGEFQGIIPARAGFTPVHHPRGRRHWDHPRSRGVYDVAWDEFMDGWGSSPLARGLQLRARLRLLHRGIIPARAGFTVACASVR